MHTFKGKSCTIHYNGDLSGELEIYVPETKDRIGVQADDILEFVMEHLKSEKIAELESMNWKDFMSKL